MSLRRHHMCSTVRVEGEKPRSPTRVRGSHRRETTWPAAFHQQAQIKFSFFRQGAALAIGSDDFPFAKIDRDITNARGLDGLSIPALPAQHSAHAQEQLAQVDRLAR